MSHYRVEHRDECEAHPAGDVVVCPDGRYFFGQRPAAKELNKLAAHIDRLESRVAELEEGVVLTADDAVIRPGMMIWHVSNYGTVQCDTVKAMECLLWKDWRPLHLGYSTREAAEAAAKEMNDE